MLKRHADIICSNMTELSTGTNISELVPKLVSNSVFSQDMIDRILTKPVQPPKLQAVSLYLSVQKRGPNAFNGLVKALMESNHGHLADKLQVDNRSALSADAPLENMTSDSHDSSSAHFCRIPQSHANPFALPNYSGDRLHFSLAEAQYDEEVEFGEQLENFPVTVRCADELKGPDGEMPEKYIMISKPRGYVLIINNVTFDDMQYPVRNGAHKDEEALRSLFEQLYFTVELHRDKTREEMMDLVEQFSAKEDWTNVDCSFVILMSHGKEGESEEDTEILGVDGFGFKTRDVISYFHNNSCPRLRDKPKVFIFQSCRGDLYDNGIEIDFNNPFGFSSYSYRTETDGRVARRIYRDRTRSDIFVAHPVPPGIKANRDIFAGAWFIQTLVQVFSQYAWKHDLEDMFKIVDQIIKNNISMGRKYNNYQTVTTESFGWNKKLYLNPGLHWEDNQVVRKNVSEDSGMDVVDTPKDSQMNGSIDPMRLTMSKDDEDKTTKCCNCRMF